jgi:hypothetical protein
MRLRRRLKEIGGCHDSRVEIPLNQTAIVGTCRQWLFSFLQLIVLGETCVHSVEAANEFLRRAPE